jgi:hypothetical protein
VDVREQPPHFGDDNGLPPSPANPMVCHLHGQPGVPEWLVGTEVDCLDFLVAVSRDDDPLPHQIQRALAGMSALFVPYGEGAADVTLPPEQYRGRYRPELEQARQLLGGGAR